MRLRVKDIVPARDAYVVVFDIEVEGPASSAPAGFEAAHVVEVGDGLVRRQQAFFTAAEAFAAAGL
jgi:hypothetical protein